MTQIRPGDTSRPAVSKSQIPSIKELLHLLGFRDASIKDEAKFTKAVHAWRKSYETDDGRLGSELIEWKDEAVQSDLTTMANNFIDSNHNGETFWSSATSKNDSSIQFPNDRPRIVDLLKQLFFNQNHYAKRNSDYAHKKPSIEDPRGTVSPLRHSSTTSKSSIQPKTKKTKQQNKERFVITFKYRTHDRPETTTLHNKTGNTQEGSKQKSSEKLQTIRSTEAEEHVQDSVEADIYDFPSDEDNIHVSPRSSSLSSVHVTTQNCLSRRRHWDSGPEPVSKRQKFDITPRRTSRLPQPRIIPESIPESEVDRYIEENDRSSSDDSQPHEDRAMDKDLPSSSTATIGNSQDEASYISPYVPEQSGFRTFAAPVAPMFAADPEYSGVCQQDSVWRDKSATPVFDPFKISSNVHSPRADSFSVVPGLHHDTNKYQATAMSPSSLDQTPQPLPQASSLKTYPIDEIDLTGEAGEEEDQAIQRSAPPQVPTSRQPLHEASQDLYTEDFGFTSEVKEWKEDFYNIDKVTTPVLNQSTESRDAFNPAKANPGDEGSARSNDAQIKSSPLNQITSNNNPPSNGVVSDNHTPPRKTADPPPVAKTVKGTRVDFWIITHKPIRKQKCWDEGRIQGKDLPTFLEDISIVTKRNDIEKLNLTLNTPFSVVELTVYKENEDSWVRANQTFTKTLKEVQKLKKGKSLYEHDECSIFIEPFYAADTTSEGAEEEIEDEIAF